MAVMLATPRMRVPALRDIALILVIGFVAIQQGLPRVGVFAQGPEIEPQANVPLGTAFPYQGQLNLGGAPANGLFDFEFALFDEPAGGLPVGTPPLVTRDDIQLTNGLFATELDFGASTFQGSERFLEVRVRPGASIGDFETLSSRQRIAATPYALYSRATSWAGVLNKPASFDDGVDNDTTYSVVPGSGILLGGTAFSADTSVLQRRVSQTCPVNSSIRVISAPGTVECEVDDSSTGGEHDHFGESWLGTDANVAALQLANFGTGFGLDAQSIGGVGVSGASDSATGVLPTSQSGSAIAGNSSTGTGGLFTGRNGVDVVSNSSTGFGVRATALGSGPERAAIRGENTGTCSGDAGNNLSIQCVGVAGVSTGGNASTGVVGIGGFAGIVGISLTNQFAGYFFGGVKATANVETANILPNISDAYELGAPNRRWARIYAQNPVIQTSDARLKTAVTPVPYVRPQRRSCAAPRVI